MPFFLHRNICIFRCKEVDGRGRWRWECAKICLGNSILQWENHLLKLNAIRLIKAFFNYPSSTQEHYMISFYMCTNQIGLKSFIAKDCPSEYILKGRCRLYWLKIWSSHFTTTKQLWSNQVLSCKVGSMCANRKVTTDPSNQRSSFIKIQAEV